MTSSSIFKIERIINSPKIRRVEPKNCTTCKYEIGNECKHPKGDTEAFKKWNMAKCYKGKR